MEQYEYGFLSLYSVVNQANGQITFVGILQTENDSKLVSAMGQPAVYNRVGADGWVIWNSGSGTGELSSHRKEEVKEQFGVEVARYAAEFSHLGLRRRIA